MNKSTDTPFFRKRHFQNFGNKDGNIVHVFKCFISASVATVLKWLYPYVQVTGVCDEFVSHLKSHQRCSAGIRPVKFFHTDWIIISLWFLSYTQRHCHVRIEKSPVQTVAIQLEAHKSLEYHYMLKRGVTRHLSHKTRHETGFTRTRFLDFNKKWWYVMMADSLIHQHGQLQNMLLTLHWHSWCETVLIDSWIVVIQE